MMELIKASVSAVEALRRWETRVPFENEDEPTWEVFLADLEAPPNPKMLAGTAFHEALENAEVGEVSELEADDYVFDFSEFDGVIALPTVREVSFAKTYGNLRLGATCDGLGSGITDYKLKFSSFDAEQYMESCQWRFYLDMSGMDSFTYQVFEGYERRGETNYIDVRKVHSLTLYRYPKLEADCMKLAKRFYEVAVRWPQIARMSPKSAQYLSE